MKPLAHHGTTARAKGRPSAGIKGCPCRPCRDAENRYDKRRRVLNETGRTVTVDATETRTYLQALFAADAGWTQLADATSCSSSTIVAILNGERRTITRRVANQILAVEAADVVAPRRSVPAIGSIRRCRALIALGHQFHQIAEACPLDYSTIRYLVNGQVVTISATTAAGVATAYRALAARRGNSTRSLNRAEREGWPPPSAWDDIDNPAAHPDWTGHCGTDRGWWMHKQQQLPMCQRCEQAHADWLAERKHLPQGERFRALGIARGQASNRGAAIADDARELMRVSGHTAEQAAERLGVTLSHLHQELARHPEEVAA